MRNCIVSRPQRLRGELWGVAVFFDPAGLALSLENLLHFSEGVRRQKLKLMIVELAFGEAPFRVPRDACDRLISRRSQDIMWHKERLINCGIAHLPPECDKVVWLDADICFEDDDWVEKTARLLEQYAVLQPFDVAGWLPRDAEVMPPDTPIGLGEGRVMPGMAAAMARTDDRNRALADFFVGGHTGFAWAIRREIVERHGLYDRHVLGGGDVTIAHSFYGDAHYWRGLNMFCRGLGKAEIAAIAAWGRGIAADIGNSISFVPGRVLHRWHGAVERRGYLDRWQILKGNVFEPTEDVAIDGQDCLCWNSDKPRLHHQVRDYFASRVPAG